MKDFYSPITDHDVFLFKEGNHFRLYDKLGSHLMDVKGKRGVFFALWAPNAKAVSVIGEFNGWQKSANPMVLREDGSGIWETFIAGLDRGATYKYHVESRYDNFKVDKGDPFSFLWEEPPRTASCVADLAYEWGDEDWMAGRADRNGLASPISIYEVHIGSWRRVSEEGNRFLTYRELATYLVDYVKQTGFTHVEFMPVMEHPFYGSWGYQTTGYFAPSARYGTPSDFMYLVDQLHRNGIGVILDWVPSHFPDDEYGLVYFDGTHLYEHQDPRKGFHPEWRSYIFNYGRNEVRAFLISSAAFWLEKYHADGLRVDGVASMLYLDYGRRDGEWIPNRFGGNENLGAVAFLKKLNEFIYDRFPDVQTIAEESTAWPMVSRPTYLGGLGFGMKWNMGWMHDTLDYFSTDPIYRKYHHERLTFSLWYAFSENFLLSLSHDEAVYGKGALIGKMPGNEWERMANMRLLFGYMYGHPGKKLLFMGGEFGQWREWAHEESLEWNALGYESHQGLLRWVEDLNRMYRDSPALYEVDFDRNGFEWIDFLDWEQSIISFLRKDKSGGSQFLIVANFTPVARINYRIGVPMGGFWQEVLNSDSVRYGGTNHGNFGGLEAAPVPAHGRFHSLSLVVPPLGVIFFKHKG